MSTRDAFWLDRALGDPMSCEGPLGFATTVRLDEAEQYPNEATSELERLAVSAWYVPVRHGGKLRSFEDVACIWRALARRDLTLAVGHGKTLLGTQPIFLQGEPGLQSEVAARVLRGEAVALAITERGNGSDLLSTITRADGSPLRALTGDKWLINNATRSSAVTVFARTRPSGGPRGFSLFFVDKRDIRGTYDHLPKIRTLGVRGADISGIRFEGSPCVTPAVGGDGAGLAGVLKTFIVTRTLIASAAVGAADSALRIALRFARGRALFGKTVFDIPHARAALCDAAAEIFVCDAASLAAARLLHAAPEEASFWSSVLKYYVPTAMARVVRELAVVFGARHYLREGDADGMFQKILRDISLLSVFDGNTLVNLQNIALHLAADGGSASDAHPAEIYDLFGPMTEFDSRRLAVMGRGVHGPELLAARLEGHVDVLPQANALRPLLARLSASARAIRRSIATMAPRSAFDMTPDLASLAAQYAALSVSTLAAGALTFPGQKRTSLAGACLLPILLRELGGNGVAPPEEGTAAIQEFIFHAADRGHIFSLFANLNEGETA